MSLSDAAGYSGKPVWMKLGITPHTRILTRNAPDGYATLIGLREAELLRAAPRGEFDLVHLFATSASKLAAELNALAKRLPATGVIWVSWPKKAAKVATDITEDTVRQIALPLGLVDIKVCAVDATWSGLKLMWRRDRREGKR